MKDFVKVHNMVDICFLILFSLISSSSTNIHQNWTIHSSDIQTWVLIKKILFAFGKSNIWYIWMLPLEHLLWLWVCVCICLSIVRIFVWFLKVLCLPPFPFLPSSSLPTPPPCQACPRCSHTQDPSARCKEPSSPRSAPHPYPQTTTYR